MNVVDVHPDEMAAALSAGRVDAVSIWNPVIIHLQRSLGNNGRTFYGEKLYTSIFCLVASQDFAKKNPESLKLELTG